MNRLVSALALLAMTAGLLGVAQAPASAGDRDCGDFATQSQAQAFFNAAGAGDPHRLDADSDGQACETLPCPCGAQAPQPFAGSTGGTSSGGSTTAVRRERGNVVRVTDGDTLKVRLDGGATRSVRIIGIDTPETYGRAECGGQKASASMRRLAPVGSRVRLVSDPTQAEQDRYGRLLRYVTRAGRDVGRAQIWTGHAEVYVYADKPFQRTGLYRRVQREARAKSHGLWGRGAGKCWRR